jgi:hypothetical protein
MFARYRGLYSLKQQPAGRFAKLVGEQVDQRAEIGGKRIFHNDKLFSVADILR